MGIGQRLNRKLENLVGNSFARVFGGNVVPQEVAQALLREGEVNVRELAGGRQLAPNHYIVQLGAAGLRQLRRRRRTHNSAARGLCEGVSLRAPVGYLW